MPTGPAAARLPPPPPANRGRWAAPCCLLRAARASFAAGLVAAAAATASGQSLADLARQEAERRAAIAEPAPVYTDTDLGRLPRRSPIEGDDEAPTAGPTAPAPAMPVPAVAAQAGVSVLLAPAPAPAAAPAGPTQVPDLLSRAIGALGGAPVEERAIFDLHVNEVPRGEVLLLFRDGETWMPSAPLEQAGVPLAGTVRETIAGVSHVQLSSLTPETTVTLDEGTFSLRLQAAPKALGQTARDLSVGRPQGIVSQQNASAFVNYGVNWRGSGIYDVSTETGVSVGGALFLTTFSRSSYSPFLRGLTSLSVDDTRRMVRWTLGDAFVPSGVLGGGVTMAGVSIAREFAIDPYFVRYPTVAVAGEATTPSTVEVYVNNHLLRRELLPPGEFRLEHLPTPTGRGVTRLVIRDAFGREQQIVSPYFVTTSILAPGLHEYRYHAGMRRYRSGSESWSYSDPTFLGRHRVGVTDAITLGFELELARRLVNGGPLVTARMPVGEVELGAAFSSTELGAGRAASAAYTFLGRPFTFGAFARVADERFMTLALETAMFRPTFESSAFAGLTLGRAASLSLRHSRAESRLRGREDTTALSASTRLLPHIDGFVNVSWTTRGGVRAREVFVGAVMALGPRSMGSVSFDRGPEGERTSVDIQRALPRDIGYGYRLRVLDSASTFASGTVQYQGPWGRYEAGYERIGDVQAGTLSAAGSVAMLGGGAYFTRPISDGFALVRVPGVAGVRAYASNQEVGRTNGRGTVLVPHLLSRYGNRVSIADDDVPLDRSIGEAEFTVAPANRGGIVVEFPVRRLQGATGSVRWRRGTTLLVPSYGQLVVEADGARLESPIGSDGEFFFEQLGPGRWPAVIEYLGETCPLTLVVPASVAPVADIGRLVCESAVTVRR